MLHLCRHQVEGVGAGGSEMFLETGFVDEGKVGGENVIDRLAIEYAHEERDHAFGDDRIRVGEEVDPAVRAGGLEPNLGLAALDQSVCSVQILGHRRELFSQSDDVFVAFLPVLEEVEVVENLLLFVRNAHGEGMGRADGGKCTPNLQSGRRNGNPDAAAVAVHHRKGPVGVDWQPGQDKISLMTWAGLTPVSF